MRALAKQKNVKWEEPVSLVQYLTRIQFDFGALQLLADELKLLEVSRPLLVTDPGLVELGLAQLALDALPPEISVTVFDQTRRIRRKTPSTRRFRPTPRPVATRSSPLAAVHRSIWARGSLSWRPIARLWRAMPLSSAAWRRSRARWRP